MATLVEPNQDKNIVHTQQWNDALDTLIESASFESSSRTRCSVALLHTSLEHHKAIVRLIRENLSGSAFALIRSQFEALARGIWYQHCATDKKVERFLSGKNPPNLDQMLRDISKLPGHEDDVLTKFKEGNWGTMNDLTHGGHIQVKARNTEDGIEVSYVEAHVEKLLQTSTALSLIAGVEIAKTCSTDGLADKIFIAHQSTFPEQHK